MDGKIKLISLIPIITQDKPGALAEINIKNICKEYNIEFNTDKCFYVNELNSPLSRGNHSNRNVSEILVCLQGSFEIKLHDGINETTFEITQNNAIYIDKNVWINYYNFKNCVILVFVNHYHDNKISCYNFDDFLKDQNIHNK